MHDWFALYFTSIVASKWPASASYDVFFFFLNVDYLLFTQQVMRHAGPVNMILTDFLKQGAQRYLPG